MSSEAFTLEVQQAPAVGTAGDEWGTPQWLIDIARQTLGGIDLDPASNAAAQERVRAARWYSKEDDGLAQRWSGRVWLNPPYSRGLCSRFVSKLLDEYYVGKVEAALLLVNVATSARWFRAVHGAAHVCWLAQRVAFLDANGTPVRGNAYAQACFYLGADPQIFAAIWGRVGKVCAP